MRAVLVVVTLSVWAVAIAYWSQLPERIPMHFGMNGVPDRFADKSIWSWLSTVDHKRIGLMYACTLALMFFIGGMLALLVRIELLTPGDTIMGKDAYNQVFTMHGMSAPINHT